MVSPSESNQIEEEEKVSEPIIREESKSKLIRDEVEESKEESKS